MKHGLILIIAIVAIIATTSARTIQHPGIPKEFVESGRVDPKNKIQLQFAIKQNTQGKERLEKELLARSDPENAEIFTKIYLLLFENNFL